MEELDKILWYVYFLLLGIFIGRLRAKYGILMYTALLSTSKVVFMKLYDKFHRHKWGIREKTTRHQWDHAETEYETCQKCYVRRYFLVYLFCPTKKRTGKYCYGCNNVGEIWDKIVDNPEYFRYNPDMEKVERASRSGRPYLLSRNVSIALERKINQKTLTQLGRQFNIKEKSGVNAAIKSGSRFVNWEEVDKIVEKGVKIKI